MKLPNDHLAVVEEAKIREYLLNADHPYGASKARFFAQFGFRSDAWEGARYCTEGAREAK